MADQFTDISSQGLFGRIGGAIKGMFFGLLLLPVAVLLLFWNETHAVTTAKSLKQGAAAVISAKNDAVDSANENKLIHLTGDVTTSETISDPVFTLGASALRLTRYVEMYQWKEEKKTDTKKNLGGSEETVTHYNYTKEWSNRPIDSTHFKEPEGHTNPSALPVPNFTAVSSKATLGAFKIPVPIITKMPGGETLAPTADDLAKLPPDLKAKAKVNVDYFYLGADPNAPVPGDARVGFKILKPATFSILARQSGDTLAPYHTEAGREIERVEAGDVTADAMFQHAARENTLLTWGLRAGGLAIMVVAFIIILNPLHVLADIVPFIGGIVEFGSVLVATLLGFAASLVVIALAWVVARPLFGGILLALALLAVVHAIRKVHEHKPGAAASA